jgi:hypothetical protein
MTATAQTSVEAGIGVTFVSSLMASGSVTDASLLRTATMEASITGAATVTNATLNVAAIDPNYANVSLLLHGNGTNGSTVFTDNSPNNFVFTGFGNAQISTAQSKFGGASILLDGNGDYLTGLDDIDYQFGTGNFTVETWVRFNSTTGTIPILVNGLGIAGGSPAYECNWSVLFITNSIYFTKFVSGVQTDFIFTWIPSINTWYHLSITRSGTSIRAFIDGVQIGSTQTSSLSFSGATLNPGFSVGRLLTGGGGSVSNFLNGYLDDIRITKGIARYTSNFTPPTTQFPDQ